MMEHHTILVPCILLTLRTLCEAGVTLQMRSTDPVFVCDPFNVTCDVTSDSLSDINWIGITKRVRGHDTVLMRNSDLSGELKNDKYKRYTTSGNARKSGGKNIISVQLSYSAMFLEDSGTYKCEVVMYHEDEDEKNPGKSINIRVEGTKRENEDCKRFLEPPTTVATTETTTSIITSTIAVTETSNEIITNEATEKTTNSQVLATPMNNRIQRMLRSNLRDNENNDQSLAAESVTMLVLSQQEKEEQQNEDFTAFQAKQVGNTAVLVGSSWVNGEVITIFSILQFYRQLY